MKKRGFTLIELLAVIIILAIIALIATPIVMNVIEKSKKGAAERSAENYIDAVEITATRQLMKGKELEGTYQIQEDGNLCPETGCGENDAQKIMVEVSGNKPTDGIIKIGNGKVLTTSTMKVGDYNVLYSEKKKAYVAIKNEVLCTAFTSKVNAWVYKGSEYDATDTNSYIQQEVGLVATDTGNTPYTPGVAYTCNLGNGEETFYVLEENGDNVTLILGRNLGSMVAWCNDASLCKINGSWNNSAGPITAMNALKERTAGWTKLTEEQITLPSGQQIATAGGDTGWTSSKYTEKALPTWLISYTKFTDGGYYGYWTSTPHASESYSKSAWDVYSGSRLGFNTISFDYRYGVRPVITISKSKLLS